jgi:hypothetical protein
MSYGLARNSAAPIARSSSAVVGLESPVRTTTGMTAVGLGSGEPAKDFAASGVGQPVVEKDQVRLFGQSGVDAVARVGGDVEPDESAALEKSCH